MVCDMTLEHARKLVASQLRKRTDMAPDQVANTVDDLINNAWILKATTKQAFEFWRCLIFAVKNHCRSLGREHVVKRKLTLNERRRQRELMAIHGTAKGAKLALQERQEYRKTHVSRHEGYVEASAIRKTVSSATVAIRKALKDSPEDRVTAVARLYAKGYTTQEIADRLHLSPATIKRLRQAFMPRVDWVA